MRIVCNPGGSLFAAIVIVLSWCGRVESDSSIMRTQKASVETGETSGLWLGAADLPKCPPPAEKAILDRIWRVGAPGDGWPPHFENIKAYLETQLEGGNDFALYSVQMSVHSLVSAAINCGDERLLEDLALVLMTALPFLKRADGSYLGSVPPDSEPATWGVFLEPAGHVVENLNGISQWLYLASSVANAITLFPPSRRGSAMSEFLASYPKFLSRSYTRLLFAEGMATSPGYEEADPFEELGYYVWPAECFQVPAVGAPKKSPKHHDLIMRFKRASRYNPAYSYCNMVLDWDIQTTAGVVELLAANRRDPVAIPIDFALRSRFVEYARAAIDTIASQVRYPWLKDFNQEDVKGFLVKPGGWRDHPDFYFAGMANLVDRPPNRGEEASARVGVDSGIGTDVAHEVRYVWVLRTLYHNREVTGAPFPARSDLQRFANQVVYRVFNGDFDFPKFRNFMDGSNGWFRVWFDQNSPGSGPFDGGTIFNGYPFLGEFNLDLRHVVQRIWTIMQMPYGGNDPYTDLRFWWNATWSCERYCEATNSSSACQGLAGSWKECIHRGGSHYYDPRYSSMFMSFLASYVAYEEAPQSKPLPATLTNCSANQHSGTCAGTGIACKVDLAPLGVQDLSGSLRWKHPTAKTPGGWEVSPSVAAGVWYPCMSDVKVLSSSIAPSKTVLFLKCDPSHQLCPGLAIGCSTDSGYGLRYHQGTVRWDSKRSRWVVGNPVKGQWHPCQGEVDALSDGPSPPAKTASGPLVLTSCRPTDNVAHCSGRAIGCLAATEYPYGDLTMIGTLDYGAGGSGRWFVSDNVLRSPWYECVANVLVLTESRRRPRHPLGF